MRRRRYAAQHEGYVAAYERRGGRSTTRRRRQDSGMAVVIGAPCGRRQGYIAADKQRGSGEARPRDGRGDRRPALMAAGVCRHGEAAGKGSGGPLPRSRDGGSNHRPTNMLARSREEGKWSPAAVAAAVGRKQRCPPRICRLGGAAGRRGTAAAIVTPHGWLRGYVVGPCRATKTLGGLRRGKALGVPWRTARALSVPHRTAKALGGQLRAARELGVPRRGEALGVPRRAGGQRARRRR